MGNDIIKDEIKKFLTEIDTLQDECTRMMNLDTALQEMGWDISRADVAKTLIDIVGNMNDRVSALSAVVKLLAHRL